MKVDLIHYTPDAEAMLIFTKNTRKELNAGDFEKIKGWSWEKLEHDMAYVFDTIRSSWEFVDYVFLLSDISRAFTHQMVRHRHASFAQQTMRSVEMKDFDYYTPDGILTADSNTPAMYYDNAMADAQEWYDKLIEHGAEIEDARGVLPTNICTAILVKMNLRAFSEMCSVRLCVRAQGEMQDVVKLMRTEVMKVHSWAEDITLPYCGQNASCIFPRFDCPIKKKVLALRAEELAQIKRLAKINWGIYLQTKEA